VNEELQFAREDGKAVPCPDCGAEAGAVCVGVDGRPITRLPGHPRRLKAAGVELRPVNEDELRDPFAARTHTAKHRAPDHDALMARRLELICNSKAGEFDQAQRTELNTIDAQLAADQGKPARPEPDEDHRRAWAGA
jgi:hypothetical protein